MCAVHFKEPIKWPSSFDEKPVRAAFIILGRHDEEGPVLEMMNVLARILLSKEDLGTSGEKFKRVLCEKLKDMRGVQLCD